MQVVYTLLAAFAVGYMLDKLRVPGGMMVGAVIGACTLNLIWGNAVMPPLSKTAAQVVAGAFIGSGIQRSELHEMRKIIKPALVVILGLLLFNLLSGFIIHKISSIDLLTAFLCTTPGGISDIPIVAADMGADASKVLVMQFVRFVFGIGIFPAIINKITPPQDEFMQEANVAAADHKSGGWLSVLLTLGIASAFGLLGKASGIPAGTMAFATLGSILFKLIYPRASLPRGIRKAAQCLSGAYVGAGIGMAQVLEIRLLLLPALILVISLAGGAYLIGMTLKRLKYFSLREAMLAATPAGASDMALISADLGIHNIRLIFLQVMRLIAVITLFPALLKWIADWLG